MKSKINLIIAAIGAALIIVSLAACAKEKEDNESGSGGQAPEDIVAELYSGVDVPPYETIPLDESNFEFYAFIPYNEGLSAAAADALVNITPHSLVVIHTDKGNGAELAEQVAANADPNKWLCVRADALRVASTNHYVVLVMSYQDTADAIIENFRNIAMELDGTEMVLEKSEDFTYE